MGRKYKPSGRKTFPYNLLELHDQLYYYALQLTENQDDARDLVQETSYKALKNYSRLKKEEHKSAWLYTILRNTHINNLRSGHKRNLIFNLDNQEHAVGLAIIPENENPHNICCCKELKENIRNLPPNYSQPLTLFLEGYSYKEIAVMTRVPIGTIKSRIYLAKEKLKHQYAVC